MQQIGMKSLKKHLEGHRGEAHVPLQRATEGGAWFLLCFSYGFDEFVGEFWADQ